MTWTRRELMHKHPLYTQKLAEWDAGMKTFPERHAAYLEKCAVWNKSKGFPEDAPVSPWGNPGAPEVPPYGPLSQNRAGNLADGMLATVAPFAMRGAIWYQGESDTDWAPAQYKERLAVMVNDWRLWWKNPELAFGVVQLPAWMQPGENSKGDWPRLRESQRQYVLSDPRAGLVVALDLGEANDIHPFDKTVVGKRLARWALADVYKKIGLGGGPEPVEVKFDTTASIRFESIGSGLWAFNGGALKGFTLAGEDGVFHEAKAEIKGNDRVEVSSPAVSSPVTVRYAWAHNPEGANLRNKQRLPAGTFELTKQN